MTAAATSSRGGIGGALLAAVALVSFACSNVSAFEYGDTDIDGHYFTYPHASGNRVIKNRGTFPENIQQYDVVLPADVTWAVATHNADSGFNFVVTTAEDKAYWISPSTTAGAPATLEEIFDFEATGDQPPLVRHYEGNEPPAIITLPDEANVSPLSHPIPAGDGVYAFIDTAGDLVLWNLDNNAEIGRMAGIDALPDARIARSVNGHWRPWLAFYAGATDWPHGCILGDCIEGSRLLIVRIHPQLGMIDVFADINLPEGDVFEGISPMFLPDDTVIATVSNRERGSVLVNYDTDGTEISDSPAMGWDGWRHQLFFNDFGTPENPYNFMVDVRGPHAKKFLQFYDLELSPFWALRARLDPYNSQGQGTRVLDTSVSADLNGDGINEALVPDEFRENIASVQLKSDEFGNWFAEEIWRLDLPGTMSSNLAAVGNSEGEIGIALGAAAGSVFRMWIPLLDGSFEDEGDGPGFSSFPPTVDVFSDWPTPEVGAPPTKQPTVAVAGVPPPTKTPTKTPTEAPTKSPTAAPTDGTTMPPTRPWLESLPQLPPQPTKAPTRNEQEDILAVEKEMQEQFQEWEIQEQQEQMAASRRQAALLGAFMGIAVLVVAVLAFVFGRRHKARKELDTARANAEVTEFNATGVLDSESIANEEEEEADGEMIEVRLDRNRIV